MRCRCGRVCAAAAAAAQAVSSCAGHAQRRRCPPHATRPRLQRAGAARKQLGLRGAHAEEAIIGRPCELRAVGCARRRADEPRRRHHRRRSGRP